MRTKAQTAHSVFRLPKKPTKPSKKLFSGYIPINQIVTGFDRDSVISSIQDALGIIKKQEAAGLPTPVFSKKNFRNYHLRDVIIATEMGIRSSKTMKQVAYTLGEASLSSLSKYLKSKQLNYATLKALIAECKEKVKLHSQESVDVNPDQDVHVSDNAIPVVAPKPTIPSQRSYNTRTKALFAGLTTFGVFGQGVENLSNYVDDLLKMDIQEDIVDNEWTSLATDTDTPEFTSGHFPF